MKTKTLSAILSVIMAFSSLAKADILILQYGDIKIGKIIAKDSDGVDLLQGANKVHWAASLIKEVRREADEPTTNRIPSWVKIISQLSTNEWASDIRQIPATVIDNGVLKNVPYISFRCSSGGYEINIYGDLEQPACVEIGAVGYNVKKDNAKRNCLNLITSVLPTDKDKQLARSLSWDPKDLKEQDGLTFETTLPDEADAYGGWWISIYNETELDNARASGGELLSITQPKERPKVSASTINHYAESQYYWSQSDIATYSRPSNFPDGPGMVYVNGYTRANGTYVQGYYRHYPSH